jgi:hypothetical protein
MCNFGTGPPAGRPHRCSDAPARNTQDAPCNRQHARCNTQQATCNRQHARCNMQHATPSTQQETRRIQQATCRMQHAHAKSGAPNATCTPSQKSSPPSSAAAALLNALQHKPRLLPMLRNGTARHVAAMRAGLTPARICTGTGPTPATSTPGLGSPLTHLHRDWAHPSHICTGTWLTPHASAPCRAHRLLAVCAVLRRSQPRPGGLTPCSSALGLGPPLSDLHLDWACASHTSVPGRRSPLSHLRRDWAHPPTSAPGQDSPLPHLR